MFRKLISTAAALALLGAASAGSASAASVDRQFSSAVARILSGVRDQEEFLAELSNSEFNEFVSCAQNVMAQAPLERKQYVLEASNQSEMRQRFDEVALDNRAALKQQITRDCS